jgi:hypothetical protein
MPRWRPTAAQSRRQAARHSAIVPRARHLCERRTAVPSKRPVVASHRVAIDSHTPLQCCSASWRPRSPAVQIPRRAGAGPQPLRNYDPSGTKKVRPEGAIRHGMRCRSCHRNQARSASRDTLTCAARALTNHRCRQQAQRSAVTRRRSVGVLRAYWLGPPCTGSAMALDCATAVGFSVARPQATSSGKREKSTMHPSRL